MLPFLNPYAILGVKYSNGAEGTQMDRRTDKAYRVYEIFFNGYVDVGGFFLEQEKFFRRREAAEAYRASLIQNMQKRTGSHQETPGAYQEEFAFHWLSNAYVYLQELAKAGCHEITGMLDTKDGLVLQDLFVTPESDFYFTGVHEISIAGEPHGLLYKVESLRLRHWTGCGGFIPEALEYYADPDTADARCQEIKRQKRCAGCKVVEHDSYLQSFFPEIDQLFLIPNFQHYFDYDGFFVSRSGPIELLD